MKWKTRPWRIQKGFQILDYYCGASPIYFHSFAHNLKDYLLENGMVCWRMNNNGCFPIVSSTYGL